MRRTAHGLSAFFTMRYLLYNLLIALAEPPARLWLALHPRHRALRARFHPVIPPLDARPVWVHACSVGEINTARPLVRGFKDARPDRPVLLTTSTKTGHEMAEKGAGDAVPAWLPFDCPRAVRRFIREARPLALVILETEIWPNLVREARRAGIPVVVVNGRISPRKYPSYRRWRALLRPVFRQLYAVGVQNEVYAARFTELGVSPDAVRVTGNLKFESVATEVDRRALLDLRLACGYGPQTPLLVFGSTRPGDEALAAQSWRVLCDRFPEWRLVVAPRHLQRVNEVLDAFSGETCLRRSMTGKPGPKPDSRVLVLDTMGELALFYALAEVAVIGGSFFPGVEGHNPLEPAALGVTTVYGPYMGNFPEASEALLEKEGAVQVSGSEELTETLSTLMGDTQARRAFGNRARRAVLAHQGAVAANIALVERCLSEAGLQ